MQQIQKRFVGLGISTSPLPCRVHAFTRPIHRARALSINAVSGALTPSPFQKDERPKQRGDLQRVSGAGAADYPTDYPYNPQTFGAPDSSGRLGEAARQSLAKATNAMSRYGWIAFWVQLTLSVVSGVILLFSVAFTSQSGPKASLYLTLVGILAGFLSTFWNFGYQRTATRMQEFLDGANVAKVKKQQVMELITRGIFINIVGMASTLLGISTLVGLLVAKTLSNASVNPFMASAAGGYNPVLALDVFLVQAATNTLLGHFLSLLCSLWLLNVVGEGRGLRFQRRQHMQRIKDADGPGGSLISGTIKGFAGVYDIPKTLGGRGGGGGQGRAGGDSWKTRAAAASGHGGLSSSSSLPSRSYTGGSFSSSSSVGSSGVGGISRGAGGMPIVAAAAVAEAAAGRASPGAGSAAAAAPTAADFASLATFAGLMDSYIAWQAAARPAAAAAAATAQALEAAALPAPPVRAPKPPEQRLMEDFLLLPTEQSLAYLDGALPGDAGFDPLGLFDPAGSGGLLDRRWLVTSEVMHGRWAMLGAVGCLVPEMLGGKPWFATGWLPPANQGSGGYWTDAYTLFAVQVALMGAAEGVRFADYCKPGSMGEPLQVLLPQDLGMEGGFAGSGSAAYPGGPVFNYFNYVESGPAVAQYKESEVRHGRLAMVAMFGYGAQAVLTGQGPWSNLMEHIQSPAGVNVMTSLGSVFGQDVGSGVEVAEEVVTAAAATAATVLGIAMTMAL